MKFNNIHIILLALMTIMLSCVNDDSFFPEDTGEEITSSIAVVTILNNLGSQKNEIQENEQCFKFVYPITLGYNNDSSIKIEDYQGLLKTISSQSANFNISGLKFPVQIIFKGSESPTLIKDEGGLLSIVKECDYSTLRQDFEKFFKNCFLFKYPVAFFDSNNVKVTINNDEEFDAFYKKQGLNYQPRLSLPLIIRTGSNYDLVTINTYFDLYKIIEECVYCPDLSFKIDLIDGNSQYHFYANYPNVSFKWYINDNLIKEVIGSVGGDTLKRELDIGNHKVCLKAITTTCNIEKEYCQEVIVKPNCPELLFKFEKISPTKYSFYADFPEMKSIYYDWYVNGQFVEKDGGLQGDNYFTYDFSSSGIGKHTVCIRADYTNCQNGKDYCENIIIE